MSIKACVGTADAGGPKTGSAMPNNGTVGSKGMGATRVTWNSPCTSITAHVNATAEHYSSYGRRSCDIGFARGTAVGNGARTNVNARVLVGQGGDLEGGGCVPTQATRK